MIEEIWRPIDGYEGFYEVSNMGFIRSLDRFVSNGSDHKRLRKGKIIKMWQNSKGYMRCQLSYNNDKKFYLVHRLVADAFIPKVDGLSEINHKDEDKTNNSVDNLEWCDRKYNNNYGNRLKKVIDTIKNKKYINGME